MARPRAARTLQALITVAPFVLSAVVAYSLARWVPPATVGIRWWVWGAAVAAISTSTLVAIDRLGRRALPLVSLLRLTLVFPDRTPSRYRFALRAFTTRQLDRRVAEAQDGRTPDETLDDRPIDGSLVLLQLMKALSQHDRLTRGHCERVRAYTDLIIAEMDLRSEDANKLRWAALLHDIGKLKVPAEILSKRGGLTDEEYEVVKTHALQGQLMCAPLAPWLGGWLRTIGEHHEHWDGGGYPWGLSGTDIHLGARIVAVADTFDVITSARSYKKPMSPSLARDEITRCAGTQFDPTVVRAFLQVSLGRLRYEVGVLAWLVSLAFIPTTTVAPLAVSGLLGIAATGAGVLPGLDDTFEPWPDGLAFVGEPTDQPDTGDDDASNQSTLDIGLESDGSPDPSRPTTGAIDPDSEEPGPTDGEDDPGGDPATTPTTSTTSVTTTGSSGPTPPTSAAPANQPPTAVGDARTSNEDQTVLIAASSLLDNDVDPDLDELSIVSVAAFSAGTVTLVGTTITFTPEPDYNGTAAFLYTITDGGATSTTAVQLDILAMPDNPVAVPDVYSTAQAVPLLVSGPGLLVNDSDPDGESVSVRTELTTQPANGFVATGSDGSFVYTPSPFFTGIDTFEYEIVDPTGRTDRTTVTVNVGL